MRHGTSNTSGALPHLSKGVNSKDDLVLIEGLEGTNEVFTPSMLRDSNQPISAESQRLFSVVLFGLFIIVLLFSILVGVSVYRSLDIMANAERDMRIGHSFLANTVHAVDVYGAVYIGEGPEGASLILQEATGDGPAYETRIYAHEGYIVQEYALEDSPLAPEKAITLIESDSFDFSYSDGLLTITTDEGPVQIALRSAGGSA